MAKSSMSQSQAQVPGEGIAELQRKIVLLEKKQNDHLAERDAALAREAALAEVLEAINASSGQLKPVFEAILDNALRLCGAVFGLLYTWDGAAFHPAVLRGLTEPAEEFAGRSHPPTPGSPTDRLLRGEELIHIPDILAPDLPYAPTRLRQTLAEKGGARAMIWVALRKKDAFLGVIMIYRQDPSAFSDREIALLRSFAAQAVIAIENTRLITEQREALEQQTATAEVLATINASPGMLAPVFEAMLEKALRLCDAAFGNLYTRDGGQFHLVASRNVPMGYADFRRANPPITTIGSPVRRVLDTKRALQIPDFREEEVYRSGDSAARGFVDLTGARTSLGVPLIKDNEVVGYFSIFRQEVRLFTDRQVDLLEAFAAQAVIAMENARLITEQREALKRQTAMAEVLAVINANPGDPQPVFDTILQKAHDLCDAATGALTLYDGTHLHVVATHGLPEHFVARLRDSPVIPAGGARDLLEGARYGHIPDIRAVDWPEENWINRGLVAYTKTRSRLAIPMRKDGDFLGFISANRTEVRPFTEQEISLLEHFAAQAVIAMENARLITETREALERQTAMAELLEVINTSPGDVTPVFEAILEKAHKLCGVSRGNLAIYQDGHVRALATRGTPDTVAAVLRQPALPSKRHQELIAGARLVHVADIEAEQSEPGNAWERASLVYEHRRRTGLWIPLRKDGAVLGWITSFRSEVRPFSDKEISLLESFAAQAVIAMENARLLGELRERTEALAFRNSEYRERIEQQSATIDVLKVMSASPGDPQPVFDLLVERARAFCNGEMAGVVLLEESELHLQAHSGITRAATEAYEASFPRPLDASTLFGRAIVARKTVEIDDFRSDARYDLKVIAKSSNLRSGIGVPILRGEKPIGAIALGRSAPGPVSATQIELLRTFAEQAVIAITSAETYRELQERTAALAHRNSEFGERIEQQSATIDVLKVMSSSPGDPQPVFEQIVQRTKTLCDADIISFLEFDGTLVHCRVVDAGVGSANYMAQFPMGLNGGSLSVRSIMEKRIIHVRDIDQEPNLLPAVRNAGSKSRLCVPLLRDDKAIGSLSIGSAPAGGFSQSQIDLLQTFAEQAVIAITSAENYRALQARTEELSRSVAELQALEGTIRAINSTLDLDTVLETIIARAVELSQADEGTIYEYDLAAGYFAPKAAFGMSADRVEALRELHIRIGETPLGRAAAQKAPLHIPNLAVSPDDDGARQLMADGIHAVLAVPLLRDNTVIGGLVIRRRREGDFAPSVPTLLQTFAGQSVLAIENARLFEQLAERGEEARRARVAAEAALDDLRRTQDRLVQTEKMASLGQLTAGIAHEIKNPLNFVNNFSDLSTELLDELNAAIAPLEAAADPKLREEIDDLTETLKGNLAKIAEHGRRADSIVKSMLEHSRSGTSERRAVNFNNLAEEALNLAYHGARAEIPGFNITMEKDLDPAAGEVELYPQEFTRVLLNLISNGFYAAHKRAEEGKEPGFEPTLRFSTKNLGDQVEIRVRDNGTGIPESVRAKIFEPFFTTKPAGEGTGLGLSLSFDIVVKQHGGQLTVDSEPGVFTEFTITLPRRGFPREDGGSLGP